MRKESELDFLVRRSTEEIELAERSRDPAVARAHRALATMYVRKVADLGAPSTDAMAPLSAAPLAMPQSSTSMR